MKGLLERGIEDEADKKVLEEAMSFIENPTDKLSEIMEHASRVGMVNSGYEMQGMDVPAEIDNMHHYILALQGLNRLNYIEEELEKGAPSDAQNIQEAMAWAASAADNLSRGYKDNTLLDAVTELKGRL